MQPKRKKQRAATAASTSSFSIPLLRSHPCHVQPLGNFYLSSAPSCQPAGLGVLHSVLTEATLLHVLSYLSPYDLLVHGSAVSQAMYVYCREEELYRNAVLTTHGGDFRFAGTWRETWVWEELRMKYEDRENSKAQQPKQSAGRHSGMDARKRATHTLQLNRRFATPRIRGFYSDALFQSFYCSAVELTHFANADNIQRVSYTDLTPATYLTRFAIPNIPFIITDAVRTWPAARWTTDWLEAEYGDRPFKVGAYEMSMRDYMQYCRQSKDESPLYLFDSGFGDKYPRLVEEYTVPWCFKDDLFELLADMEAKEGYNDGCEDRETPGAHMQRSRAGTRSRTAREERKEECKEVELNRDGDTGPSKSKFGCMRPAFRWILIGPARSGSTFHKDPNHTSAWNGLISGRKRWILYPPDQPPPGVHVSADGRDVLTPISVSEWLIHYYQQHTQRLSANPTPSPPLPASYSSLPLSSLQSLSCPSTYSCYGPVECVCEAGELLYIPNGWWHLAVNEAESVAVTQNFVSRQNVLSVVEFLQQEGNVELLNALMGRLEAVHGVELLDEMRVRRAEMEAQMAREREGRMKKPSSLWASMI